MKQSLVLLLAAAWPLAHAPQAGAHAVLDHATPAADSTVRGAPAQVKLWFTERLEPAFSTMQVQDRNGKRVDKGDPRVDGSDAAVLLVSAPELAPGTYRVTWRVLSVDAHVTQGAFTFAIAP